MTCKKYRRNALTTSIQSTIDDHIVNNDSRLSLKVDTKATEPCIGVDLAYLRFKNSDEWAIINILFVLDHPIDFTLLKRIVKTRFLRFERFFKKPIERNQRLYWESDANFNIDNHLYVTPLPQKAGKKELENLISSFMSLPFDRSRPFWEFHYIPEYEEEKCAVVMRTHHAYADGRSLNLVIAALTEKKKEQSLSAQETSRAKSSQISAALSPWASVRKRPQTVSGGRVATFLNNRRAELRAFRKLATLKSERALDIPAGGMPSTAKHAVFAVPLSLTDLKQASIRYDCSVNDIFLSALTGVLQKKFVQEGRDLNQLLFKVNIPVDLHTNRSIREIKTFGRLKNVFGSTLLELPLTIEDPEKRTKYIHQSVKKILESPEAHISYHTMLLFRKLPLRLMRSIVRSQANKFTSAVSTMVSAKHAIYLAAGQVLELCFWVPLPQMEGVVIGIGLVFYAGQIHLSLTVPNNSHLDIQQLQQELLRELDILLNDHSNASHQRKKG